jgi:Icc-related predicted phosphoesterase
MKVVHISDTHGETFHKHVEIPECDLLIHSGDFGPWKTNLAQLTEFLIWFELQPAKKKVLVAGNHDVIMDRRWAHDRGDSVANMIALQQHEDAMRLIKNYDVVYLQDSGFEYQGFHIWGSPYSPRFGDDWAFNATSGTQIQRIWAKIPSDVNILITHGPVYGFLDAVSDKYMRAGEHDNHKGCKDLLDVIKKRLLKLRLHCCGHIHDTVGVILQPVSGTRRVLFSNGAVITNDATQLVTHPFIITL